LFFILVYNAPKYYLRYYLQLLGYKAGSNFLTNLGKTGLMQQVTKAASVLGTFMIGGMVPMLISVPVTATFSMNGIEQPVIDIFNGVMPGLLELLVMFLMLFLIRKKVNPLLVVLGTFVVCILGAAVGIF
jgi:mannose/fructose/N-acetylgalactosamine-specific phosphotransferase system component IID